LKFTAKQGERRRNLNILTRCEGDSLAKAESAGDLDKADAHDGVGFKSRTKSHDVPTSPCPLFLKAPTSPRDD
jgi:hypothetical protein